MRLFHNALVLMCVAFLAACGGGGGDPGSSSNSNTDTNGSSTAANASVASISVTPSAKTVKADGTTAVTLTVRALTSGNATVTGAKIDLAVSAGAVISAPSVTTTATGVTVTLIADAKDQKGRIATVTASCTNCPAPASTTDVQVIGAVITLAIPDGSSVVVGGASPRLVATVADAFGAAMSGVDVTFTTSDALALKPSTTLVKTDASGKAQVTVSGAGTGSASVTASALGNAASQTFSSAQPAAKLAFETPAVNSVLLIGAPLTVTVSAPAGITKLTFSTTLGTFDSSLTPVSVDVVNGKASSVLTVGQGGAVAITVADASNNKNTVSRTITVSPDPALVNKILLNASQTTLPISITDGQYQATISARAIYTNKSGTDQGIANVPIEFSMSGGPAAGENLSAALAFTDASGTASVLFTSGSKPSDSNGITITARARDVRDVQTGKSPSGNPVQMAIGGAALSVAIGRSSKTKVSSDESLYILPHSVLVTDATNSPVKDQVVTLRLRPIAFSTGGACAFAKENAPFATYCSEDFNGNGSLDDKEDGQRITYPSTTGCIRPDAAATTLLDKQLTPSNSDGGSVPSTVKTDANGVASFDLTYLKSSAGWIINQLTATVSSDGTETSKSVISRLAALDSDVSPTCYLPPSPYGPAD